MIKISDLLLKCKIDVRRMLFKSIISSFGGNLELIISGGAALDEKYVHAFRFRFGVFHVVSSFGFRFSAELQNASSLRLRSVAAESCEI